MAAIGSGRSSAALTASILSRRPRPFPPIKECRIGHPRVQAPTVRSVDAADADGHPGVVARLVDRSPRVAPPPRHPPKRLLAELTPPPRCARERFSTYLPDPAQPSQAAAVRRLEDFAVDVRDPAAGARWWRFGGRGRERGPEGVYLDGGFGVGKTHLLAALWHATAGPAAFGTFVGFTHLVGALGFRQAVEGLSRFSLVCIDEFELDDPGDTVLMSRLLRELVDAGVKLAATSNTLPDALGEGRFAADDFRREIQGLAARFT